MNDERLTHELRGVLADAGLSGSFLVRDLSTGEEIGIDPDVQFPVASLIKVPLAVAVLDAIQDGRVDGSAMIDIVPADGGSAGLPGLPGPMGSRGSTGLAGPTGLGRFRHPARIAVNDLLYLTIAVSDNAAADALLGLVTSARVNQVMREAGITGIAVRHPLRDLGETPAERFAPGDTHLAHSLAIGSRRAGRGHPVPQLDVSRANVGSARAFADLLAALWTPSRLPAGVCAQMRSLLGENVLRHRLAPDFSSDASTWSSKTGSLLNLRHEVGVVEHDDGGVFAVAALTESRVPAAVQPAAEAAMAQVARALHDHLRAG